MESYNIEQLISTLVISASNDILLEISNFLIEAHNSELNVVVSKYFESLFSLENWAWEVLSRDRRTWSDEEQQYFDVFHNLSCLNSKLISSNYVASTKESLLLPANIDIIDGIFEQIRRRTDENDRLLSMIYLWFDNLSLLIYAHPEFTCLTAVSCIIERIMSDIVMSDQFKTYLNLLEDANPIFTPKEVFHIKTSTFLLWEYLFSNPIDFSYNGQQIIEYLAHDYTNIILVHSETISSWSQELLSSITHLIGLISACLWWSGINDNILNMFIIHDTSIYDYIEALIEILLHQPFHHQIIHESTNDESMLIENILWSLSYFLNFQDIKKYFRSFKKLYKALMKLDCTNNDRLNLRLYNLQSEIFSEEQMQKSNIAENIYETFFNYLQQASKTSSKKFNNISMKDLLESLLNLSKIDFMKSRFADADELKLLIKLSDTYPVVYDILWCLSFDPNVKNQLRLNQTFIEKLECGSTNEDIQNCIYGIQWNLNANKMQSTTDDLEKKFQVMISYSNQDESMFKRLHSTFVQNSYHVCNNSYNIDHNLIKTMVENVDQSKIIIICMSKNYKQSNFCRAEAAYAYSKKLKIIPILIENDYKSDGWLLSLVRNLTPIDFTKCEFSDAMQILLDESKDLNVCAVNSLVILHQPQRASTLLKSRSADVSKWTRNDVKQWLIENNLLQMADVLSGFKGTDLIRLSTFISQHSPQTNLDLLQEDALKKTGRNVSLTEVARLHGLIEEHIQKPEQQTKWTLKLCCRFYRSFLFK